MKIAELREMKTEALHGELDRLRRHLYDLRAQKVTEKLANPNQLNRAKRDIARVFTLLNERAPPFVRPDSHERPASHEDPRWHIGGRQRTQSLVGDVAQLPILTDDISSRRRVWRIG